MSNSDLSMKLYCPPVRQEVVPRPESIEKLNCGLAGRLILLTGPAGSGKSTLLADWAHRVQLPTAWFSLEADDNDPVRFWSRWIAALRTQYAEIGASTLKSLRSPNSRAIQSLLGEVLEELGRGPERILMVLDDYQEILNPEIYDGIELLLRRSPQRIFLVISTRDSEPPLHLSRATGAGLFQVGPADLRFNREQTALFLNHRMGLGLSKGQVADLLTCTQGWIAGLQVAALSLRLTPNQDDFIERFVAAPPPIFEHLLQELLKELPEPRRDFLLKTSLLDRLSGELCRALTGAEGAERQLADLYAENFPLISLDDRLAWFRYHQLFADALSNQAIGQYPAWELQALHRKARDWYEARGLIEKAFRHAVAGMDYEKAADLIQRGMDELMSTGQITTLLGQMRSLPPRVIASRPRMCVMTAWALALAGLFGGAQDLLQRAERALEEQADLASPTLRGSSIAMHAFIADREGRRAKAMSLATEAEALLPAEELSTRSMLAYVMGRAFRAQGDLTRAIQACEEMEQLGRTAGNRMVAIMAMCERATVRKLQGRLRHAENIYRAAKGEVEHGDQQFVIVSLVDVGLSDLLFEKNELAEAESRARRVVDELEKIQWDGAPTDLVLAYSILGRVVLAKGDFDTAQGILDQADRARVQKNDFPGFGRETLSARVHLWLARGDLERALRWAESYAAQTEGRSQADETRQLAWCRVLTRAGRGYETLERLQMLGTWAEGMGRYGSLIQILNVTALAHNSQGEETLALDTLGRSLSLGQPEGYARAFIQEGLDMANLLMRGAAREAWQEKPEFLEYVRQLLDAFGHDAVTQMQLGQR